MLGTLAGIIIGAAVIGEIKDSYDNDIFESLEDTARRLDRSSSYVEERHGDTVYRVYGNGHREKERI